MDRIDLHVHTTASDGTDAPAAAVEKGHAVGLRAMAVTDHDTVSGVAEAVETGKRLGMEIIPGIEVSSDYRENNVHILGYFIDPASPALRPVLEWVRAERDERNKKIVSLLSADGFDISLEQYLARYFGVKLEIVPMSFDACPTAVSSGTVSMSISGFSWKPDRAENFELSDPYYAGDNETEQVLLIRSADAEKDTSAADFAGIAVGAQNSSLQQTLVEEQLPDADLQVFGDIGVGVMELQQGNLEAIAVAKGNGEQFIANNTDLVICAWQFEVAAEYENNVVMIQKGQVELLEAVNEALAEAYAAGYYGTWYDEALALAAELGELD